MQPMLKSTMQSVIQEIITGAADAANSLGMADMDKFRSLVLTTGGDAAKDAKQPVINRINAGVQKLLEESVKTTPFFETLRLLMQLSCVTGTSKDRARAVWGTLLELIITSDPHTVPTLLDTVARPDLRSRGALQSIFNAVSEE
eukprot:3931768-Rhodomonas_salina.2